MILTATIRYHEMSISNRRPLSEWWITLYSHLPGVCYSSVVWFLTAVTGIKPFTHRRIGSNHFPSDVIPLKRKLNLSSLFQPQTNNTKNSVVSAVVNAMKESNTASSTPMVPHLHSTLFVTHILIWPYPIIHFCCSTWCMSGFACTKYLRPRAVKSINRD